jgi:hypothetical protein
LPRRINLFARVTGLVALQFFAAGGLEDVGAPPADRVHIMPGRGWHAAAIGVSALVWWQHAGTLASLGVSRARTAQELWRCSVGLARRIGEARPVAPALDARLQEGAP